MSHRSVVARLATTVIGVLVALLIVNGSMMLLDSPWRWGWHRVDRPAGNEIQVEAR